MSIQAVDGAEPSVGNLAAPGAGLAPAADSNLLAEPLGHDPSPKSQEPDEPRPPVFESAPRLASSPHPSGTRDRDPRVEAFSVSVVIAAYNTAGSILRAVDSALNQTLPPFEVIVVDDASTDETAKIVESRTLVDSRVRFIPLERNVGPSEARNVGIAAARGDWIAILDADDLFLPNRLEILESAAKACEADLIADNLALRDEKEGKIHATGIQSVSELSLINLHMLANKEVAQGDVSEWILLKPLIRRSFLQASGLSYRRPLRYGEDLMFAIDCLLAGARYYFCPEIGYLYTERTGSLSGQSSGLSRTRYDGMALAKAISDLMDSPLVKRDSRLTALLRIRLRLLRRQSALRGMRGVVRRLRRLIPLAPRSAHV